MIWDPGLRKHTERDIYPLEVVPKKIYIKMLFVFFLNKDDMQH